MDLGSKKVKDKNIHMYASGCMLLSILLEENKRGVYEDLIHSKNDFVN